MEKASHSCTGHVGVVAAALIVESHCCRRPADMGGGVGASHTGAGQSAAVVFDKNLGVADRSEAVHGVAVVKPQLAVFKVGLNITAGIFPAASRPPVVSSRHHQSTCMRVFPLLLS